MPLLDLRTLRHRTYTVALIMMSVAFMAMLGSMILLPLYLQNVRGLSPLETGLLVMPGGLAMGLLGPTVGRLFDKFGGRVLVIPGAIGIMLALTGFTQVTMTMPYWQILGLHALLMVSLAATFTPVFTLGLGALPPRLYSHGSSILSTLQQVAAAIGTALVVTVMSARADALRSDGSHARRSPPSTACGWPSSSARCCPWPWSSPPCSSRPGRRTPASSTDPVRCPMRDGGTPGQVHQSPTTSTPSLARASCHAGSRSRRASQVRTTPSGPVTASSRDGCRNNSLVPSGRAASRRR